MESALILDYWRIFKKRLWLIALLAAIGTAVGVFVTQRAVPIYRSTTTLFLNPAAASPLLPFQTTKTVQSVANTYIEFMRTRSYAGLVVQESRLPLSEGQVLQALSTQYVDDTQFFRITASLSDPAAAQLLANTAAQVLLAENIARQQAQQAQILSQRGSNPEIEQLVELRDSLKQQVDLYSQQIAKAQEQLDEVQARQTSERNEERLADLRAQLLTLQSAHSQTLLSLAQAQASLVDSSALPDTPVDTAIVVDAAPPGSPVRNDAQLTILLGLVVGLVVGAGLAFLLEYLDFTIRSPDQLESVYEQMPLGVIGQAREPYRKARGAGVASYQLVVTAPHSPVTEALRAMRTSIQVADLSRSLTSLMVTSAVPGEGKSFIAANLAVAIAQQGLDVILVDLDLRRPHIHTVFGLAREPGFTNLVVGQQQRSSGARSRVRKVLQAARNGAELRRRYQALHSGGAVAVATPEVLLDLLGAVESDDPALLAEVAAIRQALEGGLDVEQYLKPSGVENLRVLPCGVIAPNPVELLSSAQAAQVMEQLKDHADIIIYDTPPAATVTDAVVIAQRVDGVIHVVKAGGTRIGVVQRCRALLEQAGAPVLGPVLNMVSQGDLGHYGAYYRSYGDEQGRSGGARRGGGPPPASAPESGAEGASAVAHVNGRMPDQKLDVK